MIKNYFRILKNPHANFQVILKAHVKFQKDRPKTGGGVKGIRYLLPIDFCNIRTQTRGPWWSYIAHLTKQICIFTVEVSAKFTALGFLYKLYSTNHPHPPPSTTPPAMFFYKSWQLELNLKRGSPKEHFCQVILKLVQWFKKFYKAIKPYTLTAMFFDEPWQLEQTW